MTTPTAYLKDNNLLYSAGDVVAYIAPQNAQAPIGFEDLGTITAGPATTVAAGSNTGVIANIATWTTPSAGTLAVAAAAGPPSGTLLVVTSNGTAIVSYTGITGNTYTGCTYQGGAGAGATVATGAAVTFPSIYHCLGWLDTAGYIFKLNETTKDIGAAGTLASIRTILTGGTQTIDVTALESLNPFVRALFDDVPALPAASMVLKPSISTNIASYVMPNPPTDNRYSMVFDTIDGTKQMRAFAPNCKVTARGNDQQQQLDIEMLQMTFTLYPGLIGSVTSTLKRYINYGSTVMTGYFA